VTLFEQFLLDFCAVGVAHCEQKRWRRERIRIHGTAFIVAASAEPTTDESERRRAVINLRAARSRVSAAPKQSNFHWIANEYKRQARIFK